MIRPLQQSDVVWMEALHASCFNAKQRWNAALFATLMGQNGAYGFAFLESGEPCGFVLGRVAADEAEVLTIAVAQKQQRKHIGLQLMQNLLGYCTEKNVGSIFLEVAVNNTTARALYTKLGFADVAIRKDYYQQPQGYTPPFIDCVIMKRACAAHIKK